MILAFSLNLGSTPDGKQFYLIDYGPVNSRHAEEAKTGWVVGFFDPATMKPVNRFNYSGTKKLDKPVYYLGTLNEPGDDEAHFKSPTSATIDDKGRIWVGDAGCIKIYDSEGKFLKRIDKTTPGFEKVEFSFVKIGANYKSGEVYFATGGARHRIKTERKLYKLASYDNPKIIWSLTIEKWEHGHLSRQLFVVSEKNIVLVAKGAGHNTVLRIEDKGEKFEKKVIGGDIPGKLQKPQWTRTDSEGNIYVYDQGRKMIVKSDIDGNNFKEFAKVAAGCSDGYFCMDHEGNLYVLEAYRGSKGSFRLRKFGPDGKQAKIGGKDALTFTNEENEWMRKGERPRFGRLKGVYVAENGDIYIVGAGEKFSAISIYKANKKADLTTSWVNVYTKDGELKKAKLIQMASPNDIQIGRDGIYTVEAGMPLSPHKRGWARKKKTHWTNSNYLQKFSLDGGVQGKEGHLWSHAGVGYVNTMGCSYECAGAQICVDDDDRIWIPEHIVFNVKAVDSAGNLIKRIGTYGNGDCDGDPKGKNPKPAIPIAWPSAIARYKDYLLITDRINARIVRCRLEYAEEKILTLP